MQGSEVGTEHKQSSQKSPLVEVEKKFRAPVSRVFEAWANANLLREWWGPEDFNCPSARIDFKVDGEYLFCMRSRDKKKEIWSTGRYLEIDTDRKILCTSLPCDAKGRVGSRLSAEGSYPDIGESFITIDFEALSEDITRLKLSHERLPKRIHDECVAGWSSSLEKLRALVESH